MVARREAGGRCADGALGRSRAPRTRLRSHRTSACRPGYAGSPTATTRPPGRTSADRVGPAAHGLLPGAQVGPRQHQPGVEQHHGGVPALGDGLGPRRGHHDGRLRADLGQDRLPRGRRPYRRRREGPAELLGGPQRRRRPGRAARGARTPRTPSPGGRCRTSGRRGGGRGSRDGQRALADRAAGGGAAALAGQRRRRTPTAASARAPDRSRAPPPPRRARGWASGRRGRTGRAPAPRRWLPRPARSPGRAAAPGRRPARAPSRCGRRYVGLDRAREPADQRAALPSRSARSSSVSRVWGYGARGSACRSSPSSQITTRPRSCTGANAAARVPTTTRRAPRETARKSR